MVTRFLGTFAGGIITFLLLKGIAASSIVSLLIAAAIIAVVWIFIPPVGKVTTLWLDMAMFFIPSIFLDAAVIMLLCYVLPGMEIASFWWAVLGGCIILLCRRIGTKVSLEEYKKQNNTHMQTNLELSAESGEQGAQHQSEVGVSGEDVDNTQTEGTPLEG